MGRAYSKRRGRWVLLAVAGVLGIALGVAWYVFIHRVEGTVFDSQGVPIHYTREGTGEPVLLLHGFAVNGDLNFRLPGITDRVAEQFEAIAMDQRGHGLSGKPHDAAQYGVELVEDVRRLLDHLGIERVHLVGYSLGGFVALRFAASHPERLYSVSVLGAGWERPDRSSFLTALDQVADDLEAGRGVDPLATHLDEDRKPSLAHRLWVRVITQHLNDPLALAALVRSVEALGVTEDELRAMEVPVCSIVGSEDPLRPGAAALDGVVTDLTSIVVQDADHLSAAKSEELHAGLIDFLKRRDLSRAGSSSD